MRGNETVKVELSGNDLGLLAVALLAYSDAPGMLQEERVEALNLVCRIQKSLLSAVPIRTA